MNKTTQKKINTFILIILSFVVLSCSDKGNAAQSSFKDNVANSNMPTVQNVLDSKTSEENNSSEHAPNSIKSSNINTIDLKSYKGQDIDVDLTEMNPMLVFGEVFNMVENPHQYIGKVIKLEGYYASFADIYNGKYYFFVSIEDALACCAQGMEFIFDDDNKIYPDDYPADGSYIQIVGKFDVYEWQEYTFFRIVTDSIAVL